MFSSADLLTQVALERMLAGVATRRHALVAEPIGTQLEATARSGSKSAVSRRFKAATEAKLAELLARDLSGLDVAAMMTDGIVFAECCIVVALAITSEGAKVPVGLWEGGTENTTVVKDLLADLVSRGLSCEAGVLFVLDGSKALAAGVQRVFGDRALVQRCQLHKRRGVGGYLPKSYAPSVDRQLAKAFADTDAERGLKVAKGIAVQLDERYPSAAASLREGLDDMFTVRRLGPLAGLARSLTCTNAVESMISVVQRSCGRVTNWKDPVTSLAVPHSRFNEIPVKDRERVGYRVLSRSTDAGWTVAVGERGACQLTLLQGHPEYQPLSLLREYRRDVRGYLLGSYGSYPHVPTGYLTPEGEYLLAQFQSEVSGRTGTPDFMDSFPFEAASQHLAHDWEQPARALMATGSTQCAGGWGWVSSARRGRNLHVGGPEPVAGALEALGLVCAVPKRLASSLWPTPVLVAWRRPTRGRSAILWPGREVAAYLDRPRVPSRGHRCEVTRLVVGGAIPPEDLLDVLGSDDGHHTSATFSFGTWR